MGAPGGGKGKDDTEKQMRMALSDRIEENLGTLLVQAEEILRENRNQVLALAHALETFKTMSGEDVAAVIEGVQGSVVDGRPYLDPSFLSEIERYHSASVVAHREHRVPDVRLPAIPLT
jgi:fructose/tagatose bisphosphate aldolase